MSSSVARIWEYVVFWIKFNIILPEDFNCSKHLVLATISRRIIEASVLSKISYHLKKYFAGVWNENSCGLKFSLGSAFFSCLNLN